MGNMNHTEAATRSNHRPRLIGSSVSLTDEWESGIFDVEIDGRRVMLNIPETLRHLDKFSDEAQSRILCDCWIQARNDGLPHSVWSLPFRLRAFKAHHGWIVATRQNDLARRRGAAEYLARDACRDKPHPDWYNL